MVAALVVQADVGFTPFEPKALARPIRDIAERRLQAVVDNAVESMNPHALTEVRSGRVVNDDDPPIGQRPD
jgi:hypothetical protein